MQEIEAKILEVNSQQIQEKLKQIGAKKISDGNIETVIYDFKDGSIIKAKNVLRLRKENNKAVLTFKEVKTNAQAKIAEEHSVEVSDFDGTKRILGLLGLEIIDDMQKRRISYKLGNTRFDIDKYLEPYDFIPALLEIEAESAETIHKYAEALGFTAKDCLPWSTAQVIEYYSARKKS